MSSLETYSKSFQAYGYVLDRYQIDYDIYTDTCFEKGVGFVPAFEHAIKVFDVSQYASTRYQDCTDLYDELYADGRAVKDLLEEILKKLAAL